MNRTTCKKKFAVSLHELRCSFVQLTNLTAQLPLDPGEMFSQVTHLHIKHLPEHVRYVSFTGVPRLTLDDAEAFRGLTSLKELMLVNCGVARVATADWFRDLRSLTHLELNMNKLTSLDAPPPTSTPTPQLLNLAYLNVSSNAIARVDAGFLACMANLTHLSMSANALTCLEHDTLSALTHLKVLDVSQNNIARVEARAFSRLDKLVSLHLSSNELTSLSSRACSTAW